MRKCVVSFANNSFYQEKMKRLENSLKGNFDGDFLGFTSFDQVGCKPHSVVAYQFKPYSIQKAIDLGYELILWLDSPIVAIKDIQPVFDHIETNGYLFFENIGHPLGKWTNDKCLDHFEISREEAMNIKQIMACIMGFNNCILNPFYRYRNLSDELYAGSWDNHRHDQTVMSFIIHENNMNILQGHKTFFAYQHFYDVPEFQPLADSICLISK